MKSELLTDFNSFILMHRKGMKDDEIMDSLMINENAEDYFYPLFSKYTKLIDLMDSRSFYNFIYNLEQTSNSLVNDLLGKIAYPLILLIAIIISAYFFDKSIIPMLNDSILLFSDDSESLFIFQSILRGFWIVALIITTVILITFIRLKNSFYQFKFYEVIYKVNPNNVLVSYCSNEFAKYYLALLENGLSTNIIIDSLINQNAKSLVCYLAMDIRTALNNGNKLTDVIENIHIDHKLKQTFKIGEKTGELMELLKNYLEISEILIKRKVDKFAKSTTYSIYLLVSLFIALFYRLLMTPLSVIKSL